MPEAAVTSLKPLLGLRDKRSELTLYQFSVFDQPEDIRLLVIQPGQGDDEISCTLSHQSLRSKPLYQALSYTWDSNVRTHGVMISRDCCMQVLPVTANLHAALKRFRNPDQPRTLWVDAICINQDDIPERIMGQIYTIAKEVLIWLGDGPENVEEAFKLIKKFEHSSGVYDREFIRSMHQINPGNSILWRALSAVLNKSWFMRAWIIQEVVLAAHAQVFCGDQTSSWTALTKTVNWLFDNGLGSWSQGLSNLAIARISLIQNLWHRNQGPTDGSILLDLDLFNYTKAKDPRDKVYSLLSLTSGTLDIKPDYTVSCEELYTFITASHLENNLFYVLCCVDRSASESGLQMPSWVPNWAAESLLSSHIIALQFSSFWGFKAAADTQPQWTYSEHEEVLSLTGLVFDTISRTAEHIYDTVQHLSFGLEDAHAKFYNMKKRFQEFDDLAVVSETYPGKETFEDAYSRLFVMNQPVKLENKTHPPYQLHRICYRALRDFVLHLDDIKYDKMKVEEIDNSDTIDAYLNVVNRTIPYRRFCATEGRYLGWLPETGAVGDLVCIFTGAPVPFLLRPVNDARYKLIGACYIQGIMYGEGLTADATKHIFDIC